MGGGSSGPQGAFLSQVRRQPGWLLAVWLLMLVVGCGQAAQPGPAGATAPPVRMTVSYSNQITDFLPLWIAREARIFQRHGLEVDLQLITSSNGIPALLSGQTQVAHEGGSETLSAAAEGAEVVVIGTFTPVYPFRFYVPPDVKSAADLKGKKVGVNTIGATADIATRVVLRGLGLEPDKDVTIVQLGSTPNRVAAMLNGAIQGSVNSPPDTLILEAKGFHPLMDLAQLKLPSANAAMITRRSYLASNRPQVQRYVDSVVEAIAREKKDRPFAISVLKKYLKKDDDEALGAAYDFYSQEVLPSLPYPRPEQFADAQQVLGTKSKKVHDYPVATLLDPSLVKSSEDRRVGQ